MKWVSPDNLQQAAVCMGENRTEFEKSVLAAFNEVYENMEAIDQKTGGFTYIPEERKLVFSSSVGTGKEG